MPGPVAHVTDAISNGRRQNLDEYIKQIIGMPPHISRSMLVRNLFRPKPGQDFEIDPNALNDDYRLSSGSQQSLQRIQSNQQQATRQPSNPQLGNGASTGYGGMGPPPVGGGPRMSHQRQQPSLGGGGYGGLASPNGGPERPYLQTQPSNLTASLTDFDRRWPTAEGQSGVPKRHIRHPHPSGYCVRPARGTIEAAIQDCTADKNTGAVRGSE